MGRYEFPRLYSVAEEATLSMRLGRRLQA
jgi:hypothetical protein